MFYFIIILIIVILILVNVLLKKEENNENKKNEIINVSDQKINYFPLVEIISDNSIVVSESQKINNDKIKNALATIDNTAVASTKAGKNIKNAKELLDNNKVFFSTDSKSAKKMLPVEDKFYGLTKKNNKFDKPTKFSKENEIIKSAGKQQLVGVGMQAPSMIVGQYYMEEINQQIKNLTKEIDKVNEFNDTEYDSKIISIISKINEINNFKDEIYNSEFNRNNYINKLDRSEEKCTELLGQANQKIENSLKHNLEYKEYVTKAEEIQKWLYRRDVLIEILKVIADIKYNLNNGNKSLKLCCFQYNNYAEMSNKVDNKLENWHMKQCEKFGINMDELNRKDKFHKLKKNTVGLIKEEWAYKKIETKVVENIQSQINQETKQLCLNDKKDEKIKIIKKNENYYYLK